MTTFTYNTIVLKMLTTNSIKREAVHAADGHTLIRIKWTFDVTCLYNPGDNVTSYSESVVAGLGHLPPVTDKGIKDRLMTPRKPFEYKSGATILLSLPAAGDTCDVANGPIPIDCNVDRVDGVKTWRVRYVLVCHTVPCNDLAKKILAHTYSMEHNVDEQELTTRVIDGEVTFARHVLAKGGLDPDDFRKEFAHPRPPKFVRTIRVKALEDGLRIRYQIVDRQLTVALGDRAAVKIEAFHTVHGENGLYNLEHLHIRAWGRQSKPLKDLVEQVIIIAAGKIPLPPPGAQDSSILLRKNSITTSLTDRFVELQIALQTAEEKNVGGMMFPAERVFKQGTYFNLWLDESTTSNPKLPNSSDLRGTYLEKAVANALRTPCEEIKKPGFPGNARG